MANTKIAFQGEMGAYSHIACEKLFPGSSIKACPTFEETFRSANQDENCKIFIPIENSLAGRVADIHYLLPKYKLQIYAEHFQTVEHNLLVKDNAELKDIKYIRSHAQAIDQCQNIIQKHKFETIISADTAGSARELSKNEDKSMLSSYHVNTGYTQHSLINSNYKDIIIFRKEEWFKVFIHECIHAYNLDFNMALLKSIYYSNAPRVRNTTYFNS